MCDQSSSATNGPKSELSRTDSSHVTMPASIAQLETIKREVESRQEILGKSWHDLHEIMSKYHATLVLKHEQFEASVDAGDRGYLVKLELSLEKANEENHRLERTVSDLQASLLAKENEIVHLRQENNKLRKETKTKDNLIEKLQNQMAREAMDYSNEINALKELLESDGGLNCGAMVPTPPTSTTNIITSGNSRKRAKFETGNVTRSQTSMKSDAAPSSCLLQSGGAQAQYASLHPAIGNDAHLQTFSMATMPHLTLATTSTDAMHVDSSQDESTINPDESAEGDYAPFTELLEQKLDDPDTDMLTHNAMQSQQSETVAVTSSFMLIVKQEILDCEEGRDEQTDDLLTEEHTSNWTTSHDSTRCHNNVQTFPIKSSGPEIKFFPPLSNNDKKMSMSVPFGAPKEPFLETDDGEHLAPINLENIRLPTGVIAMAPSLDATPPRLHHCPYCYRYYSKATELRTHMQIHLGTHMYPCEVCHRSFTQKGNLDRHRRVVHKIAIKQKKYRTRNTKCR